MFLTREPDPDNAGVGKGTNVLMYMKWFLNRAGTGAIFIYERVSSMPNQTNPNPSKFDVLRSPKSGSLNVFVEGGILLALAVVLNFIKFWTMPLGGSIDLCAMLPILLFAYKHGPKWGCLEGFAFALIQLLLDSGKMGGWGLTPVSLVGSIVFDYLIAFTVLGIAGVYGKSFPRYILGMITAVVARLASHTISGAIFYASSMPSDWVKSAPGIFANPFGYSIAYNALYILPDLALCLIVGIAVYWPLRRAKLL